MDVIYNAEQIYEAIRLDIIKQNLKPGQRLTERELAKKFAVSRTPIRQALQRLVVEGLVEFTPYKGATVKRLHPEEFRDLYQVRMALERLATELFCTNADDKTKNALQININNAEEAVFARNVDLYKQLDVEFHKIIILGSGNKELPIMLNNILHKPDIYRTFLAFEKQMEISLMEHKNIFSAIMANHSVDAGIRAAEHVKRIINYFTDFLRFEGIFRGY